MLRSSSFCWLLILVCWACTKVATPADALRRTVARFPIVVQGRWGFIDSTGVVVVAPHFAQVQAFSQGLAPVREAGHYGYIDPTGRLVIAQQYAYASAFHQGLAMIAHDTLAQLIDPAGHM
ncbi:MAG: WG repeat-containing protein, partial [Hymenobacter sp.]